MKYPAWKLKKKSAKRASVWLGHKNIRRESSILTWCFTRTKCCLRQNSQQKVNARYCTPKNCWDYNISNPTGHVDANIVIRITAASNGGLIKPGTLHKCLENLRTWIVSNKIRAHYDFIFSRDNFISLPLVIWKNIRLSKTHSLSSLVWGSMKKDLAPSSMDP